ncbi:hypothetical protein ABFA07_008966 [Porites harrisoni]
MRVILLLLSAFATLNECLQGRNQPNRIWKQHKLKGIAMWRKLFGLKHIDRKDDYSASGVKVQGTARLRNGKVKLDLSLNDVSTVPTTLPTSATTATGSSTATSQPTTGSTSSVSSTSAATQETSGSPTTMGTTVAPTTVASSTAAVTTGSTTAGSTAATTPTSSATTMATSAAPTSASTVVTAASTLPSVPVTQPSPPPQPGVPPCKSPVNVNIKIVANEVLRSHNAYRRTHGSPDLHLDDQMICDAQKYAEDIAFKGVLKHQSSQILAKKSLGENIGMSCAPVRDGPLSYGKIIKMAKNVAKHWYDEVCQYNFDDPKAVPKTGHFTEVVWSGSKNLGIGHAVGKNPEIPGYECVYVVGRYKPAGNIIGGQRLKMNVKKGKFNADYCQTGIEPALSDLARLHEVSWDKRNELKHKESYKAVSLQKHRRPPSHLLSPRDLRNHFRT